MADLVIGLTGGIASGKSEVVRRFSAYGIDVVDADHIARVLVQPGEPALAEIVDRFGPSVLGPNDSLDRGRLRALVFEDAGARRDLEAILHPRIRAMMRAACKAATSPYAVADIPLLLESGGRAAWPWLSRVLVVDVPRELQLQRLVQREGIDAGLAGRMLASQGEREARRAIADDVIDNSGTLAALEDAVAALHLRYLALAGAAPAPPAGRAESAPLD